MRQRKIYIIILLLVILVTGCKKQYNLYVKNDKIIEEIDVEVINDDDNSDLLKLNYYPLHANEEEIYNKEIKEEKNILKAHFDYTYKPYDFVNSNSVNDCFKNKQIIVDNEDYYYFKLSTLKQCMNYFNLDINIITDNKVLANNADKVRGNKYTWYLREKNKEDFEIEIKISKKEKRDNNTVFVILGSLAIVIVIISLIYFLYKNSKSNNI